MTTAKKAIKYMNCLFKFVNPINRINSTWFQLFSILAEIWIVIGVPIFLLNHGVVYCAGYVPFDMSSTLYAVCLILRGSMSIDFSVYFCGTVL